VRWIAFGGLMLFGCFSPSFESGKTPCVTDSDCPPGLHCAATRTCWRSGVDPIVDLSAVSVDLGAVDFAGASGFDLAVAPPIVFPPASVWISAGGGSGTGAASQMVMTFGGGATVLGESAASNGATYSFGMLASGE
jgi:hypothetical protein